MWNENKKLHTELSTPLLLLHKRFMDQYSLIYILRRTEQEGVTRGHLYSALLLFGKGHVLSHELSIELLGHGGEEKDWICFP